MKRLRSAAGTGRKLHLGPEHLQVLLSEEVYRVISNIEATEIRRACAAIVINDNNVGTSGSGSDATMVPGASAGSNIVPLDAASRGARARLAEAMSEIQLRKKQSML
ncbi:MAG: hypothetical protein M3Q57_08750 [Pseudomonadota bacterium]|nr:hypothetical protein [Pseudomonadota bacterium]